MSRTFAARLNVAAVILLIVAIAAFAPLGRVAVAQQATDHDGSPAESVRQVGTQKIESLQRTIQLLRTPGFHPELMELFEISEPTSSSAPATPSTAAISKKTWITIVFVVAVLAIVGALAYPG